MLTEKKLRFLSEKLQDLQTALFLNQSDAVLKLPAAIIHLIKVDEAAQLWFFIPRPTQQLSEFERAFLSRVQFYQKGKDFYVKIQGRAHIVSDPEEINGLVELNSDIRQMAMNAKVLIKVKIEEIDYYEVKRKETLPILSKLGTQLRYLIFNNRRGYKSTRLRPQQVAYQTF